MEDDLVQSDEIPAVQPEAVDEVPEQDSETDLLGIVRPGDREGLAHYVVRRLGFGDGGDYSGGPVERVMALQDQSGLEPDGIVRGRTWALLLPEVAISRLGGHEAHFVRQLLGLRGNSAAQTQAALATFIEGDVITKETWLGLIESNEVVAEESA